MECFQEGVLALSVGLAGVEVLVPSVELVDVEALVALAELVDGASAVFPSRAGSLEVGVCPQRSRTGAPFLGA